MSKLTGAGNGFMRYPINAANAYAVIIIKMPGIRTEILANLFIIKLLQKNT